uniref:Translin-associated factor X-interacting protein 1 N-terminal domain-containing protein n=1 Tax=Fundulus heteroclitus TaxID=8078 RepID=A0A3Q2SWK6_FUNHE
MSGSRKQKQSRYGSYVCSLLLAAKPGHKEDPVAFPSGHLGSLSMDQTPTPKEAKPSLCTASQRKDEGLNKRQAWPLGRVRKKQNTSGAALEESEVLRSKQDQAKHYSSHGGTRRDTSPTEAASSSSNALPQPLKDASKKESNSSSAQATLQLSLNDSKHATPDVGGQPEVKPRLGDGVTAKQDVTEGAKVAEVCERKLQKVKTVTQSMTLGNWAQAHVLLANAWCVCVCVCCCLTQELKKLSALSWPSRDRLAVFSDVFDDVCEGSPVFGRILREIKTEYDLYISVLMDSHSSQDHVASVKDTGEITRSDKEVEEAGNEVRSLEEKARRAAEENERVQDELKNLPAVTHQEHSGMKNTSQSRSEDGGTAVDGADVVQLRTLKLLDGPEEEARKTPASAVAAAATERLLKDELQKSISLVLDREQPGGAITRMLWSAIHKDLQTDGEYLES